MNIRVRREGKYRLSFRLGERGEDEVQPGWRWSNCVNLPAGTESQKSYDRGI
jgi:hypothetical protein